MSTVILLGFSTTGKSSIIKEIKDRNIDKNFVTIDTDKLVSKDYDNHIYNIYLNLVIGQDRVEAIKYIEKQEDEILDSIYYSSKPRIIAAGPMLPFRKAWRDFVERIGPICIYLEKSPRCIYDGLIERRERHIANDLINKHPAFGSWDQDITTKFENGKWILLPKRISISNIEKHLNQRVGIYNKYSNGRIYNSVKIKNNLRYKKKFYSDIELAMGLTE